MSRADNNSTMTQQDAVAAAVAAAADELKRFCQQLVFHGQFKSLRWFIAGSQADILKGVDSLKECGLSRESQDVDKMLYRIDRYAFPLTQRVPVEYNGTVLRIHSDGLHPGYVRLIDEKSGEELQHIHGKYGDCTIHGPARQIQKKAEF